MNCYRVVTERDGATTKVAGQTSTEIERQHYHYVAASLQHVWEAISFLREDPECNILAVHELQSGVTVITAAIDEARQEEKP